MQGGEIGACQSGGCKLFVWPNIYWHFTPPLCPLERLVPNPKLRFLEQRRAMCRFKRFACRTAETYVQWICRFIVWSGKRHPREMGAAEVGIGLEVES